MLRDKLTTDTGSFTAPERTSSSFLFIHFCQVKNELIQTEKLIWICIVGKFNFLFQAMNKKSEGPGCASSKILKDQLTRSNRLAIYLLKFFRRTQFQMNIFFSMQPAHSSYLFFLLPFFGRSGCFQKTGFLHCYLNLSFYPRAFLFNSE